MDLEIFKALSLTEKLLAYHDLLDIIYIFFLTLDTYFVIKVVLYR